MDVKMRFFVLLIISLAISSAFLISIKQPTLSFNTVFDTKATFGQLQASISIDSKAPLLTLDSPTNTTYSSNTISIRYTAIDEVSSVSKVWYNLDNGQNNTLVGNTTFVVNNGTYVFRIYANDSFNQVNTTRVTFTVGESGSGGGSGGGDSGSGGTSGTSSSSTIESEKKEDTTKEPSAGTEYYNTLPGTPLPGTDYGALPGQLPPGSQYFYDASKYDEGSFNFDFDEHTMTMPDGTNFQMPSSFVSDFADNFGGEGAGIFWKDGKVTGIPKEFKDRIAISIPADWKDGMAMNIPPNFIKDFAENFVFEMSCPQPPCTVMSREIFHEEAFHHIMKDFGEEMLDKIKKDYIGEVEVKGAVQLICGGGIGSSTVSFEVSGVSCNNLATKVVHDDESTEEADVKSCSESSGITQATASFNGCSYLLVLKVDGKKIVKEGASEIEEEKISEKIEEQTPKLGIEKEIKKPLFSNALIFYSSLMLILLFILLKIFIFTGKKKK